jgi:hypothetical protein
MKAIAGTAASAKGTQRIQDSNANTLAAERCQRWSAFDERIGMQNPHTADVGRTSSLGASELLFRLFTTRVMNHSAAQTHPFEDRPCRSLTGDAPGIAGRPADGRTWRTIA